MKEAGAQKAWPLMQISMQLGQKEHQIEHAVIQDELFILALQECPICMGFGHSMNDCNTNAKLESFKKIPSTSAVVSAFRKYLRKNSESHAPGMYSMLRPRPLDKLKGNIEQFGGDKKGGGASDTDAVE